MRTLTNKGNFQVMSSPYSSRCIYEGDLAESARVEFSHPAMENEIDILASFSSECEQCETDKKIALEESPQDLAHNALVREGIKDAGMNYNIILSMPDDIQSIIHRTALRRQLSRQECGIATNTMSPGNYHSDFTEESEDEPGKSEGSLSSPCSSPRTPPYATVSPRFCSQASFRPQDSVDSVQNFPHRNRLLKFPKNKEKMFVDISSPAKNRAPFMVRMETSKHFSKESDQKDAYTPSTKQVPPKFTFWQKLFSCLSDQQGLL